MFTHSECEISQSWRTQFSSHGAFNLNRADMPLLPLLERTTSLDTSSRTLFVREGGRMSVHVSSNVELRNNVRLLLNVELRNYIISRQIVERRVT